jgi:hypothetical protein
MYLLSRHLFAGTEENYENTLSIATTRAKTSTSVVLEYETEALTTRQCHWISIRKSTTLLKQTSFFG